MAQVCEMARSDVSTLNVFRGMLLSVLLSVVVFWLPLIAVLTQLAT